MSGWRSQVATLAQNCGGICWLWGVGFDDSLVVFVWIEALFEGDEEGLGIDRLLHLFGFEVLAIADVGEIGAEFFDEGNEFDDLLLGEQVDLEHQVGAFFGELFLAALVDEYACGDEKGCYAQAIRSQVEFGEVFGEDAEAGEVATQAPGTKEYELSVEKFWLSEAGGDAFDRPMMGGDGASVFGFELDDGFDILPDWFGEGFDI